MRGELRLGLIGLVVITSLLAVSSAGVAAQSTATATADDVTVPNEADSVWTEVRISASQGVSAADTGIRIDTEVAEVTDVRSPYNQNPLVETEIGPDGSYVWLNYTDMRGAQSEFVVGEIEITAQTGQQTQHTAKVLTENYNNANYEEFSTVNQEGFRIEVGAATDEPGDNQTDEENGGNETLDDGGSGEDDTDSGDDTTDEETEDSASSGEQDNVDSGTADNESDSPNEQDTSEQNSTGSDDSTDGTDTQDSSDTVDGEDTGSNSDETGVSNDTGADTGDGSNQSTMGGQDNETESQRQSSGSNTSSSDTESEGLPGFTVFVSIVAVLMLLLHRAD